MHSCGPGGVDLTVIETQVRPVWTFAALWQHFVVVTEYARGDLFNVLQERKKLREDQVRTSPSLSSIDHSLMQACQPVARHPSSITPLLGSVMQCPMT